MRTSDVRETERAERETKREGARGRSTARPSPMQPARHLAPPPRAPAAPPARHLASPPPPAPSHARIGGDAHVGARVRLFVRHVVVSRGSRARRSKGNAAAPERPPRGSGRFAPPAPWREGRRARARARAVRTRAQRPRRPTQRVAWVWGASWSREVGKGIRQRRAGQRQRGKPFPRGSSGAERRGGGGGGVERGGREVPFLRRPIGSLVASPNLPRALPSAAV